MAYKTLKSPLTILLLIFSILLISISSIYLISSDFGNIEFTNIYFDDNGKTISGQLYKPTSASSTNKLPGIVLAHGVTNAKETMNDLALELAKENFVTLTIDELAHGNSEGQRSNTDDDRSLGVLGGIRYLESLIYVDSNEIGLIGHSMGAGAVQNAAYQHGAIKAVILLGGSLISNENVDNDLINATFPQNLLIAIGQHDVLFDLEDLRNDKLKLIFNSSSKIMDNTLYGDFNQDSARKLITPSTIHLLEPIDPTIVAESIDWMVSSLKTGNLDNSIKNPLLWSYQLRTIFYFTYFTSIILLFIAIVIFLDKRKSKSIEKKSNETTSSLSYKHLMIFSILSLILFFPLMLIGVIIPIPPVSYGSSLAWWLFGLGIFGFFILYFKIIRKSNEPISSINFIKNEFDRYQILTAISTFTLISSFVIVTENLLNINAKIIVPLFNDLFPLFRLGLFFIFLPFYLIFNFVDVLITTKYNIAFRNENQNRSAFVSSIFILFIKILPFIIIVLLQVVPMFLLNIRVFPGMIGFFMEFLFVIIPLLVIGSIIAIIIYKFTEKTGYSIILNTFIFSWISASLFPIL
ncbi:MAG: alpha/beta hydrolase [Candidatus Hodarchaeales archaeon]|jgi:dienelactone hydrolase